MEKVKIQNLMFITAFLILTPKIRSLPPTNPLCISQIALVNHACSMLPLEDRTPHPPHTELGQEHEQENKHELDSENEHGHGDEQRHRHRHSHHHSGGVYNDCCRWLRQVDSLCVCELLLRLPPFLRRPAHAYTVSAGDDCEVTFNCAGRVA